MADKPPAPVVVANPEPIPVEVTTVDGETMAPKGPIQRPSTTTVEQNLRTAGQRKINLIWEYTQAGIAISVVIANILFIFALLFIASVSAPAISASQLLANAFFLVIGFYFGRTNHARIGDESKVSPMDDR